MPTPNPPLSIPINQLVSPIYHSSKSWVQERELGYLFFSNIYLKKEQYLFHEILSVKKMNYVFFMILFSDIKTSQNGYFYCWREFARVVLNVMCVVMVCNNA